MDADRPADRAVPAGYRRASQRALDKVVPALDQHCRSLHRAAGLGRQPQSVLALGVQP